MAWLLAGACALGVSSPRASAAEPASTDGAYRFVPIRRSMWVFCRPNGRFAVWHYIADEERTIERSRVETLDGRLFPPGETQVLASDRHLTECVWVANSRTGDVQLWACRVGAELQSDPPVRTLSELLPDRDDGDESVVLRPGSFRFLPDRRSIWVVHRDSGRFGGYFFLEDQDGTVERTRVATADPVSFPAESSDWFVSDRNFAPAVWVGDRASGRVRMWSLAAGGELRPEEVVEPTEDLGAVSGDHGPGQGFAFAAVRRTMWVANREAGKLIAITYPETSESEREVSRAQDLDLEIFPPADTDFLVSDRHLTEAVWVVNRRTGDVQLWTHEAAGVVRSSGKPLSTSIDLGGDSASADESPKRRYRFLPTRRTIWVVDELTGRFAGYHFRDDEGKSIERTRIEKLDTRSFPESARDVLLSERNFAELLWVGNRRTGDVQMWIPGPGGNIAEDEPIQTMIDLMDRRASESP